MLIADDSSPDKIIATDPEDGMRAIYQLASCRPRAIAYGCPACSILQGHAYDERLVGHVIGAKATTAPDSIVAACRALGPMRSTAISRYTEAVDAAEHRCFAEGGIETIIGTHLGDADGFRLAEPKPEAILKFAPALSARCQFAISGASA